MSKVKAIIKSFRLRTLPLSLAGIVLGIFLAYADYRVKPLSAIFVVLTAIFLQILANLSNELGDVLKGTDRAERQGPQYGLNSGVLSISQMKTLVGIFVVLCTVSGILMIQFSAFGSLFSLEGLCFLMLLVSAIGFFSVGVLNVNNIRDAKTDAATRVTVAILMGPFWSRVYQTALIVASWACALVYCSLRLTDIWNYLFVLTAPLFIAHLVIVWKKQDKALDPALPLLVMSSLLFAILMGFGFVRFLL